MRFAQLMPSVCVRDRKARVYCAFKNFRIGKACKFFPAFIPTLLLSSIISFTNIFSFLRKNIFHKNVVPYAHSGISHSYLEMGRGAFLVIVCQGYLLTYRVCKRVILEKSRLSDVLCYNLLYSNSKLLSNGASLVL